MSLTVSAEELADWVEVFEQDKTKDGTLLSPDGNGCRVVGAVRIECRKRCGWTIVLVDVDDPAPHGPRQSPYYCPRCGAKHMEDVVVDHWERPLDGDRARPPPTERNQAKPIK